MGSSLTCDSTNLKADVAEGTGALVAEPVAVLLAVPDAVPLLAGEVELPLIAANGSDDGRTQ